MPNDAVARVGELGRCQGMPKSLTFADRYGHEIRDVDGDSTYYDPADDDDLVSTESSTSYDSDDDDSDDKNDNDDDNDSQP
jgi:hypothetical protein